MGKLLAIAGAALFLLPAAWSADDLKQDPKTVKGVIAEYTAATKEFLAALRAAQTPEERAEAQKKQPKLDDYAGRLLVIAQKDPKSAEAGEALMWIANTASRSKQAKAAVDLIIEHQAASASLTPAMLDRLSFNQHPKLDKFFARIAAENSNAASKEAAAEIAKLLVGKVVPNIAAEDTDGKEFKLSDYRGKVVLIDFWGHW